MITDTFRHVQEYTQGYTGGTRIASPPSTDNTIIRKGECFGSLHSSLSHVHGSIFLIFSLSFLLPLGNVVVADFSHVGSVVSFVVTNFFFAVFVMGPFC